MREAVDLRDVRVIERGERLRLAVEARQTVGIERELGGQDLQGDVAPELGIAGAVHLAHSARADAGPTSYGPRRVPRRESSGTSWRRTSK